MPSRHVEAQEPVRHLLGELRVGHTQIDLGCAFRRDDIDARAALDQPDIAGDAARIVDLRSPPPVRAPGLTPERRAIAHAGPAAATAIGFVQRSASRSGRISAMPIRPTTSMMMPQIMKPVLKPTSGVAAVSTTLPMT